MHEYRTYVYLSQPFGVCIEADMGPEELKVPCVPVPFYSFGAGHSLCVDISTTPPIYLLQAERKENIN